MEVALMFAATGTVIACCLILVFHPDFHTGPIGCAGLALIGVGAVIRFDAMIDSNATTRIGVLVWTGMALWLGQTLWNFLRRKHRKDSTWYECDTLKRPRSAAP